jgi:hypothetical protein
MPRILYNPQSDTLIRWPRQDDEDVVGLQPPTVMLWIEQQPQPTGYDTAEYELRPTQDVDLDARVLRRGWSLVELPPVVVPPTPRWVQFAQALAIDSAVNGLVVTCATSAPVLHLMLGVGLGQAAQGDPATFLAAWGQAVTAGLASAELAAQMQSLAAGFDLPAEFVEGLG